MKINYISLTLILLFLFGISNISYEQEQLNAPNYITPYIGDCTSNPNGTSVTPYQKTQEQINLENQIRKLRENSERNGVRDPQLDLLTRQLSTSYGETVKPGDYYPATVTIAENRIPFRETGDDIQNVLIQNSNTCKAIKFAVEYTQGTAGRIWCAVAYQGSGSSSTPDTVRIYYSNTNGSTWVWFGGITLGGTDKVNYDDLDLEILESSSGDKYLWGVYGLRQTGGTGRWFTGGFVFRIVGAASGSTFAFSWPANDVNKRYYNVRITTDNTTWTTNPWIFIICSFDSANASNLRDNSQKLVRCTSPNTVTPTFSYKPDRPGWYMGTFGAANYYRTLFSDIAYFRNGGNDSLIISFSGVPDSTKLFFSKISTSAPSGIGFNQGGFGGSYPTDFKYGTQIATNGNSNGGCWAVFTQRTSGINYNKYFRTTNYGNFSTIAGQSVLLGHETGNPDLMGKRNISTYVYTFISYGSTDSVWYSKGTHTSGASTMSYRMNSNTSLTGTSYPGISFRNVNNDSCLVGYIRTGPSTAWVAGGCSGSFTGLQNSQIPVVFNLNQNYPNPFNPSTLISFSIPKMSNVKLAVYDVMGREVAVIINGVLNPDNYEVEFNASSLSSGIYFYKLTAGDFSDVKKMMLVK